MNTVAFFDIDGTLITDSIWDYYLQQPEIAPAKRGAYARFLPVFARRKLGLIAEAGFREAWVKEMARIMRGWERPRVEALFDRIIYEQFGDRFRKDVASHVSQHMSKGDRVILVSGMFDGFAARFANMLGVEAGIGTVLDFDGETCTGKIAGRGCAGVEKPAFMRRYLGQDDLSETVGYADSYSDVPMLSAVAHPIATYPDEQLRAHAVSQNWDIFPR
jgi:HAD superfamily hydrolase (TIGR01490 family)